MKNIIHACAVAVSTSAFSLFLPCIATAQDGIHVLVTRTPSLVFYADKMKDNKYGVPITTDTMLLDKIFEVSSITFSSGSSGIDVVHLNDPGVKLFASKGWLEPLDDLWAKYKDTYSLDDYPKAMIDAVSYKGHIYAMPVMINTQMLFYRKDVFDKMGIKVPETMDDYLKLPKILADAGEPNIAAGMKPVDYAINRIHWFLNTMGDGWFDKNWNPVFNSPNGLKAIEAMKETVPYAPRGWTSHGNDEDTINLSQGISSLGLQWTTRAASMQDPTKSKVVDKIGWAAAPGGGARIAFDGFAIPKSSAANKEEVFKIMAEAMSPENMKVNADRAYPPRISVASDPELEKKFPWYPAVRASIDLDKPTPDLPEFNDVAEIVVRRVLQALTGEMEVKPAMDNAAEEVRTFLASKGYYK
ncbi:extracellular solute-binding protein [Agrobacterium sp. LAD9]|uniref:extracellular solute-binding protein n=1 Tax=Agrobacterium sp. LAD9 TaxID=2055153 RepID=UPI0018651990|nr:extracellular solute-binding protein [Agrobacterium sp. LAD9]